MWLDGSWKCQSENVLDVYFFHPGHRSALELDSSFLCTIKILTGSEVLGLKF